MLRRTGHIVKLYLIGVSAYLLWLAVSMAYEHKTILDFVLRVLPDQAGLTKWVVLQSEFLVGHLWYLHALIVVYLLYWVYLRFVCAGESRHFLYVAGFIQFALMFLVGVILPIYDNEFPGVCRNAYLIGIPMFIMGIFIHEYEERIISCFRLTPMKLIVTIVVGELFTVQQWYGNGRGMPFGTIIACIALILLLVSKPQLATHGSFGEIVILKFGVYSTWIYLFHLIVDEAYTTFFQDRFSLFMPSVEPWIHPILIFIISGVLAVAIDLITGGVHKYVRSVSRV